MNTWHPQGHLDGHILLDGLPVNSGKEGNRRKQPQSLSGFQPSRIICHSHYSQSGLARLPDSGMLFPGVGNMALGMLAL